MKQFFLAHKSCSPLSVSVCCSAQVRRPPHPPPQPPPPPASPKLPPRDVSLPGPEGDVVGGQNSTFTASATGCRKNIGKELTKVFLGVQIFREIRRNCGFYRGFVMVHFYLLLLVPRSASESLDQRLFLIVMQEKSLVKWTSQMKSSLMEDESAEKTKLSSSICNIHRS